MIQDFKNKTMQKVKLLLFIFILLKMNYRLKSQVNHTYNNATEFCLKRGSEINEVCTQWYDKEKTKKKSESITINDKKNIQSETKDSLLLSGKYSMHVFCYSEADWIDSTWVTVINYTRCWYESGQIEEETIPLKESDLAIKKYYYENGSLKKQGTYRFGRKCGLWAYYSEQKIVLKTEIWDNGILISKIEY